MAKTPRVIRTPKPYWVGKRVDSHSDWKFAIWREFFQNAGDAGARKITIRVEDLDGQGSWGRPANDPRVVRITFTDDGSGITPEVLENVFFSPGESTKRSSAGDVGGFGTARTMLCFSQSRYAVRSGGLEYEGDGSEYDDTPLVPPMKKGTEFEIDIPAMENNRRLTAEDMRDQLRRYLAFSQVSANVTLDGEPMNERTRKGQARRQLVTSVDGQEVAFATVYASQGEKSAHKGKVIVRVQGATMFVESSDIDFQVVVELIPEMSRKVLTDNRDSLKYPYSSALLSFLSELSQDKRSALDEDKAKQHLVVRGGLGNILVGLQKRLAAADWNPDATNIGAQAERVTKSALRYESEETYAEKGFGGVSASVMDALLDRVRSGEPTFLDTWGNTEEVAAFRAGALGDGSAVLGRLSPDFAIFVTAGAGAVAGSVGVEPQRMDEHDVHIYKEGLSEKENKKLFNAARRWSPGYWRKEGEPLAGRGIGSHMTLAAWTVMCRHAAEYLGRVMPNVVPKGGLKVAGGFAFIKDGEEYDYERQRTIPVRTGAVHKKHGDVHGLLLNPVDADGEAVYDLNQEGGDPSRPKGLVDMMALAIHESAHILRDRHDEQYASVLTTLMAGFMSVTSQRALREDLRVTLDAVRAAYGRGTSRIQTLDVPEMAHVDGSSEKVRPAERLRAMAQPAITMVLGTVTAPSNIEAAQTETPALLAYIDKVVSSDADCTTLVDCNAGAALEVGLHTVFVPAPVVVAPEAIHDAEDAILVTEIDAEPAAPVVAAGMSVDLSSLDLGGKAAPVAEVVPVAPPVVIPDLPPEQILAALSAGRFARMRPANEETIAPPSRMAASRDLSSAVVSAAAPRSFADLISSGGLAGLSERMRAGAQRAAAVMPAASMEDAAIMPAVSMENVVGNDFDLDDVPVKAPR